MIFVTLDDEGISEQYGSWNLEQLICDLGSSQCHSALKACELLPILSIESFYIFRRKAQMNPGALPRDY